MIGRSWLRAFCYATLCISCTRGWYGAPQAAVPLGVRTVCLDVPEALKPEMARAVANWNRALNGKLELRVAADACDISVLDVSTSPCPETALACTDTLGGSVVYMKRGFYERQPANILAHELGHAFGAQHVEGTLMAPIGAPQDCPDHVTIVQVAAYNHWNLAELRWCSI